MSQKKPEANGDASAVDPVDRIRISFRKSRVVPFSVEFDRVALFRAFEKHLRFNIKADGWTNDPAPADALRRVLCGDENAPAGFRPSQISAAAFIALRHFVDMADAMADEFERLFVIATTSGAKALSEGARPVDDRSTPADLFRRADMKDARDVATLDLPRTAARRQLPKGSGNPRARKRTPGEAMALRLELETRLSEERSAHTANGRSPAIANVLVDIIAPELGIPGGAADHLHYPRKLAKKPRKPARPPR